jgi:TetR/AcrR family transcriptional regulator, repressor for neighboring sulfatase
MKQKRVRRAPEVARQVILEAALDLFARRGPDAIGLKDVARKARVSHALVTHYFGTYDRLVEAAFRCHVERSRAAMLNRVAELSSGGPRAWVELASAHLGDPLYGRLAAWALLSGRAAQDDFFTTEDRGLRKVADAIVDHLRGAGAPVDPERVDFAILLVMTSSIGYALARSPLWGALGDPVSPAHDARFRDQLAELVSTHLGAASRVSSSDQQAAASTGSGAAAAGAPPAPPSTGGSRTSRRTSRARRTG